MKQENISNAARGYKEYHLVIRPCKKIEEKILTERQLFYDDYKQKANFKTSPHIAVASFLAKEGMENTVIRWMQRIFSRQQSFSVTLNNYSGFPPDTIYVRVQDSGPFIQLAKELNAVNAYINSSSCPPMMLTPRPHVSIAGNLPREVFFKALTQYAHRSFHESFQVNQLLLLKNIEEQDAYKPIIVFGLRPVAEEHVN